MLNRWKLKGFVFFLALWSPADSPESIARMINIWTTMFTLDFAACCYGCSGRGGPGCCPILFFFFVSTKKKKRSFLVWKAGGELRRCGVCYRGFCLQAGEELVVDGWGGPRTRPSKDLYRGKKKKEKKSNCSKASFPYFSDGIRLIHSSLPTDFPLLSPQYSVLTLTQIITLALSLKKLLSAPTASAAKTTHRGRIY